MAEGGVQESECESQRPVDGAGSMAVSRGGYRAWGSFLPAAASVFVAA